MSIFIPPPLPISCSSGVATGELIDKLKTHITVRNMCCMLSGKKMHNMGSLNIFWFGKFSGGVMIYVHGQKVNACTVLNQF